jgi:hypothetical protein
MFEPFVLSFYIPGTLAANHTLNFLAPFDLQLLHVSLCGTNANNANMQVGYQGSAAAYMVAKDFGDSSVPLEYDRDDFVSSQFPHIADGTNILLTVDYDGSAGTAIANAVIVLTFTRG